MSVLEDLLTSPAFLEARHGQDPGDENDGDNPPWRTWRIRIGKPVTYWPWSWRYERAPTQENHDGGDEDPWQPLSEVSRQRLNEQLGL